MVLGRRRNSKNLDQAVTGDASENASAAVLSQLRSMKTKSSLQGSNVAVVDAEVQVDLRPDLLFELLADPNQHTTIFDAIEGASCRLVAEEGPWRKYELDYKARWKFWRVSGVCDNKVYMETHADHGTVSFKLREPGFLKMYEGTWVVKPAGHKSLQLYSRNHAASSAAKQVHKDIAPQPRTSSDFLPPGLLQRAGSPPPPWSGLFQAMTNATQAFTNATQTPKDVKLPWGTLASINMPLITLQGLSVTRGSPSESPATSPPASPRAGATADVSTPHTTAPTTPAAYPNSSIVQIVNLRMCPKVAPPYPLGGLLKGHAQGQVEEMIRGLVACASKLQASGVTSLSTHTHTKDRAHSTSSALSTTSSRIATAHDSHTNDDTPSLVTQSESMASLYSKSSSSVLDGSSVSDGTSCGLSGRRSTWHSGAANPMQKVRHAVLASYRVPVGESLEEDDEE